MILVYLVSTVLACAWIWGMGLFVCIAEKIEERKKKNGVYRDEQ